MSLSNESRSINTYIGLRISNDRLHDCQDNNEREARRTHCNAAAANIQKLALLDEDWLSVLVPRWPIPKKTPTQKHLYHT